MTEEEKNQAIARIILSTRRKIRPYSLYDVAKDISSLKGELGNINKVSEIVHVSPGMLNRFLNVFKLPPEVLEMIKNREIDSVSVVTELSKLNDQDVITVVKLLVDNKINSQDLRVLIPYRKSFSNKSIGELVTNIHKSKNIKISVIKFHKSDLEKPIEEFCEKIKNIISENNFIGCEQNEIFFELKITKQGEQLLRQKAKEYSSTLQNLISNLLK